MLIIWSLLLSILQPALSAGPQPAAPLRLGVAGLTHGHVGWILGREDLGDVEIVGIAEADEDLAGQYAERYGFDLSLVYPSLEEMLEKTRPEAVAAFNSIAEHRGVVEACAPRGIHVMVEKPLAFVREDARQMAALARQHGIHLLTNYETTWYPANHEAFRRADAGELGTLRKIVVRDGHSGPKEIGVGPAFLEWLTDPKMNGGGALIDFGCYGANIATRFMKNVRPDSVTAVTRQFKPDIYSRVDDEATILLDYPGTQVIIQASWNWPFSRKDMDVYGATGYLRQITSTEMELKASARDAVQRYQLEELPHAIHDPFAYLAALVRGSIEPEPLDLSGLENNLLVVDILDAARLSARTGQTVDMRAFIEEK